MVAEQALKSWLKATEGDGPQLTTSAEVAMAEVEATTVAKQAQRSWGSATARLRMNTFLGVHDSFLRTKDEMKRLFVRKVMVITDIKKGKLEQTVQVLEFRSGHYDRQKREEGGPESDGTRDSTREAGSIMARKTNPVYVIGVGMTKFEKPGRRNDFDYPDMVKESVGKALEDAGILYSQIQQASVGYVYGDSTCGQRALYECGLSGIPILNVNNNCATGGSALFMAHQVVAGGNVECALAVGFEKMKQGSLSSMFDDRTNPLEKHAEVLLNCEDIETSPMAAQMFGGAAREHMRKYGTTQEQFAKIAEKNHRHSVNNPNSQFRDEYTLRQIMESSKVYHPLTKLQCCPTSDGSAAVILASKEFVLQHKLEQQAVAVLGMEMASDFPSSFNEGSCIKMAGFDLTRTASQRLFAKAGLKPDDVDVIELHDCFASNELITYEALGLCPIGKASGTIISHISPPWTAGSSPP
eukprot:snap_masked-scaffold33_size549341-processed-gene-4.11 protein:Tk11545 transcript:snap_masked-scaffold33_size549341-processed-gene-4.11-mRNA-1 annotation:"non-specific lipid-transfer"